MWFTKLWVCVYSLLSTVYCLQSTVYCLQSTVYSLLSTDYCLQTTVYSLLSTVYCLQSTVYCLQSTVYSLLSRFVEIFVTCSKSDKPMISALFGDITRRRVVIPYGRFGTSYRSHLNCKRSKVFAH